MNAEEKQALTEHAKSWIVDAEAACDEIPFGFDEDTEMELSLIKIAFAALTAQPDDWQQRAEAAEAKLVELVELEKQQTVSPTVDDLDVVAGCYYRKRQVDALLASRPAPAINLAELVPGEMTSKQASRSYGGEVAGYRDGFNACRAAILRKIEEAK